MRAILTHMGILLILWIVMSCDRTDPDPDPDIHVEADITLDDLLDMEVYDAGMVVDCRFLSGSRTSRIVLNDVEYKEPITLDLTEVGYYGLEIYYSDSSQETPHIIRMVVLDPIRGETEWGLPAWTPQGIMIEPIENQGITTIYPRKVPLGFRFPLVVVVEEELTQSIDNMEAAVGASSFLIKRGTGSTWISSKDLILDQLIIDHSFFPIVISETTDLPLSLSGVLVENTSIPAESYINVASDLTIPEGITLTIGSGTFVTLNSGVNIYNEGTLRIEGLEDSPITFTCADHEAYWGGVLGKAEGNRIDASHAIFGRSGHHEGGDYDWGHAHRQALFYSENGSLSLDHCYMIDHIGQVLYPVNASLEMDYCLVQRAKTGGQLNNSLVSINHSIFTDFPDDSFTYRDEDNDALYLMECVTEISNSVFMYAKDDGLDSGGGGGGELTVRNTRFESIFHEGAALSGGWDAPKRQNFYNCVFMDCGQGLELGYSSSDHRVTVDSSFFHRNGIGIRYGDNYEFSNNGYITVSNSQSIENRTRDIWNMDREDWIADTSHMEFKNVWVTKNNPMYPQLNVFK